MSQRNEKLLKWSYFLASGIILQESVYCKVSSSQLSYELMESKDVKRGQKTDGMIW